MATAEPRSILQRRPGKSNVLECGVCEDVFGLQGDKVPRLLLCGHTLCHDCLTRLPLHGRAIRCPFDRQMTEIGDSGVWGLKKNFALLELLERLQFGRESPGALLCDVSMDTEKETTVHCDEIEDHLATIYCTVCSTNLCAECAQSTHNTRTLAKHKLVPLHERPREKPMCPLHQTHAIEFACLEESCLCNPLMCYVCKDYGKHQGHKDYGKHQGHKHTLIENDAEQVRVSIIDTLQHVKGFLDEVSDSARRLGNAIQQMEGCSRTVENEHGFTHTEQIHGTAEEAHVHGMAEEVRICIRRYFQGKQTNKQTNRNVLMSPQMHGTAEEVRICICRCMEQQKRLASACAVHGTAEEARVRVRRYFQDLHETLHRQENAALSVVDTHVREKLCSLKQQQEDMAVVVSQVTTICLECEKMLQQDDHKILLAKQEIRSLLDTVRKQQQQFCDLPEQLNMDAGIPLTFTKI
ncbi:PREDICTED: E3 ubiquitin-protein ligase TRIM23-like [Branchiostoma belcheri]|uniref:RING-type E3 ubiquitin transferase n=1 Tax=Branchiostoma belcheri TaxID=7741 RepID=A0A6P4ZCG4_BRABE|nr:PREDICTED: E3 ubiquitin-protein ligase TRIM23-like [Branchiostoma belcheri]